MPLLHLPSKLLEKILSHVERTSDLRSLALVCKDLNKLATAILWEQLTIFCHEGNFHLHVLPSQEENRHLLLASKRFGHVKHLTLTTNFHQRGSFRCLDMADDIERHVTELSWHIVTCLIPTLAHVGAHLESFRWDLGVCLPDHGATHLIEILAEKMPHLKELVIVLDPDCTYNCNVGLNHGDPHYERLLHLRKLSIAGLRSERDCLSIGATLFKNRQHLEELHLDFLDRSQFCRWNTGETLGDLDPPIRNCNLFTEYFFYAPEIKSHFIFSALKVLSLAHFSFSSVASTIIGVVDFSSLQSLHLRHCFAWEELLEALTAGKLCQKLKSFRLQYNCDLKAESTDEYQAIKNFIASIPANTFTDLHLQTSESNTGPEEWSLMVPHQKSLKTLVHHPTQLTFYPDGIYTSGDEDLPDLGIFETKVEGYHDNPRDLELLAQFDLEFLGICCNPKYLAPVLEGFKAKTCLKVLHIRQTASGLAEKINWGIHDVPKECFTNMDRAAKRSKLALDKINYDLFSGPNAGPLPWWAKEALQPLDFENEEDTFPVITSDFHDFANWIFGPDGISSIDVLLFGEFSYEKKKGFPTLSLCRVALPGQNTTTDVASSVAMHYRHLVKSDEDLQYLVRSYMDSIIGLPSLPILEINFPER